MGVLQGYQRFHALGGAVRGAVRSSGSSCSASSPRPAIASVERCSRRSWAPSPASRLALLLIREPLGHGAAMPRPDLRPFLRYLGPVAVGLVGIALLTHVDILIVKARFSGDDAGAYAAASAFARVGFFLPGDHPHRPVSADGGAPGARRGDAGHPRPLADRDGCVLRRRSHSSTRPPASASSR